jgi:hypothetical protein
MRALSLGEAGASLGKSRGLSRPGDPLGDRGLKNKDLPVLLYLLPALPYLLLVNKWCPCLSNSDICVSGLNMAQTEAEAPM